jgi:5-aminolevulinate synthase
MTAHLDFFTQEMQEFAEQRRQFLEIGRHAGRFPSASAREGQSGAEREISVWCSNDYLGMGQNPAVLTAMKEAVDAFGAGSGGSRSIGGTNYYHVLLEQELAALHGKEAATGPRAR